MIHISRIGVPVVALAAGIALGAFYGTPEKPEAQDAPKETTKVKFEKDAGQEATIRGLRARVAELEKILAEKQAAQGAAAEGGEEASADEARQNRRDRRDRRDRRGPMNMAEMRKRMDEFKRDHPEEYAEMVKRRDEFNRQVRERAQARIDFLASVDTSNMSESGRTLHDNYQKMLTKREELRERLFSEDITDEEREQAMHDMRENDRAIRESSGELREMLIKQTAEVLGYSGEDVSEIASTLMEVMDATEGGGGRGGRGGPGGPGGGMPPPPPAAEGGR